MRKAALITAIMMTLVFLCSLALAAELPAIPPMPDQFKNIKITKPAASVPKEIADFLGEWEGVWKGDTKGGFARSPHGSDEVRRAKIIIYEVTNDKLKALYGRGDSPYFYFGKPGWDSLESEVVSFNERKRFSLQVPGGRNMQFYTENNELIGTQGIWHIKMRRVK